MQAAKERVIGILETVPSADAEERLLAAFAILFCDSQDSRTPIDKNSGSDNDKGTLQLGRHVPQRLDAARLNHRKVSTSPFRITRTRGTRLPNAPSKMGATVTGRDSR